MGDRLTGKVAIVTGSTGGVGEGIARRLACEGASVVVSGRREEAGERVAKAIGEAGGAAMFHQADVGVAADCIGLVAAARERFGRLDFLVNNAADLAPYDFAELTADQWDAAFNANVGGPMLLAREVAPLMRGQGGGSIVNIGTCMAYRGPLDRIAYACSKGALLTLTKSLAGALVQDRIRVNWITVGWVASPQEIEYRTRTHGDGGRFLEETGAKRPLGRHETPEDIAAGVLYLVSEDGSHVTGCELNISGGIRI